MLFFQQLEKRLRRIGGVIDTMKVDGQKKGDPHNPQCVDNLNKGHDMIDIECRN